MATKKEIRKRELIQQLEATREATKSPRELIGKQAIHGLTSRVKGNLGEKINVLAYQKPMKVAIGAGVATLLMTLLFSGSSRRLRKRISTHESHDDHTIIKYLPAKKKKTISRRLTNTASKFAWTLALPYLKSWLMKEATRKIARQVKTETTRRLRSSS